MCYMDTETPLKLDAFEPDQMFSLDGILVFSINYSSLTSVMFICVICHVSRAMWSIELVFIINIYIIFNKDSFDYVFYFFQMYF